jgi:hypothetical protein
MKLINILFVATVLVVSTSYHWITFIYADEENGGSTKVGPEQAITQFDPKQGIQLSKSAINALDIQTQNIMGNGTYLIPKAALVQYQDEAGIYRLRNQWFKLLHVQILSRGPTQLTIKSAQLTLADKIVIRGAPLLRVADLTAPTATEAGHEGSKYDQ